MNARAETGVHDGMRIVLGGVVDDEEEEEEEEELEER